MRLVDKVLLLPLPPAVTLEDQLQVVVMGRCQERERECHLSLWAGPSLPAGKSTVLTNVLTDGGPLGTTFLYIFFFLRIRAYIYVCVCVVFLDIHVYECLPYVYICRSFRVFLSIIFLIFMTDYVSPCDLEFLRAAFIALVYL